jgi:hypothetical protein
VFSSWIGRNDHSADMEWGGGEEGPAVPAGCYNSSPRETMSNLAKVVIQLRRQRARAQKRVETAGSSVDGPRRPQRTTKGCKRCSEVRNETENHVRRGAKENRCTAACTLGKMEG